jgi:hypothetical protein
MKNRPKDIARWVAPVSSNPQDETGLGSASREAHDRFSASNLFTNLRLTRALA